jgi:hydrogenase maturation protease
VTSSALVIGIGNPLRGDDGVGVVVAERIRARGAGNVDVTVLDGDGASLVERWAGAAAVIVVDATRSAAPPGSIERFDAVRSPLPCVGRSATSHGFGLAEAVELARALDRLPPALIVYGIAGRSFEMGEGLSPAVAAAVPEVVARVLREAAGAGNSVRP